ncbi:hypothetical protein KO498_16335 [Lentibacter algarum]|uniref:hypothetical protein n=1 Tax=Lentibacter algarum TaxID=576131 RepID=UPI001C0A3C4D|nr:hypothetical protein [Lentibacter algarum]MBU2983375.1 hypothetical protein [Lentibacter algarum]
MRIPAAIALVLGLAGCSTDTLVTSAYPDREVFRFRTSDGADVNSYTCERGPTVAATKARAGKAHAFFDKGINAIGEKYAVHILNGVDPAKINKGIGAEAEVLVDTTEARYQCLFFDAQ